MRIVITGASGNVGSSLLRRLSSEGHELVGVARRVPAEPAGVGAVSWVSADLSTDACVSALRRAFEGADAVVHLAWGFQPTHDEAYLERLGVGGTRRVRDLVAELGVPHLVHQSSIGVYSPRYDDRPVDESWPVDGIPTSPYSRHKVAAERLLDELDGPTVLARTRPALIGQRTAASSLLRYGVPALVPARALRLLPVLPLDRRLRVPMVHADDVADGIARILGRRAAGPFNLSADPPLTRDRIAEVLGARPVHVPSSVLRTVVAATWHARLQKVDAGWLDLASSVPLLDSSRARDELGWAPRWDAVSVLREVLAGMLATDADQTAVLRRRTVLGELRSMVRRGSGARRQLP